jgi:hypothetical protein
MSKNNDEDAAVQKSQNDAATTVKAPIPSKVSCSVSYVYTRSVY